MTRDSYQSPSDILEGIVFDECFPVLKNGPREASEIIALVRRSNKTLKHSFPWALEDAFFKLAGPKYNILKIVDGKYSLNE